MPKIPERRRRPKKKKKKKSGFGLLHLGSTVSTVYGNAPKAEKNSNTVDVDNVDTTKTKVFKGIQVGADIESGAALCLACDGKGESSKGWVCAACDGKGAR